MGRWMGWSLSGHELLGTRTSKRLAMVRHVYMDEGGKSNPLHEPFVVEAAIIVDIDKHKRDVETVLHELACEYLPEHNRRAPFHAKDIWHGTKNFHRDRLSLDQRARLLRSLAKVPADLGIPVVWYAWPRKDFILVKNHDGKELSRDKDEISRLLPSAEKTASAILAFKGCVLNAERWMRAHASTENATIIHEDTNEFRNLLRNILTAIQEESFWRNHDFGRLRKRANSIAAHYRRAAILHQRRLPLPSTG
jgi:hypothetical protein